MYIKERFFYLICFLLIYIQLATVSMKRTNARKHTMWICPQSRRHERPAFKEEESGTRIYIAFAVGDMNDDVACSLNARVFFVAARETRGKRLDLRATAKLQSRPFAVTLTRRRREKALIAPASDSRKKRRPFRVICRICSDPARNQ